MAHTVEITELLLREAQQSLLETSIALEDVAPVCEELDNAGYWSVECWGGMAFNSCIRFLNEDPWQRLRTYRRLLPKSRLQMLLRGQNLVDHRNFDDSIVRRFVEKAALNGIDVFRIFDALNDVRNLEASVEAVKKAGITPVSSSVSMVPDTYIKLEGQQAAQMIRLMEALEDNDDVQNVHANFDIDQKLLEEVAG